jgi:TatA/E family protein of Tat protein translocase
LEIKFKLYNKTFTERRQDKMLGEGEVAFLLILGLLILIFFGKNKLPEFGNSVGKFFREVKKGMKEEDIKRK